jgi:nucleoside phosphorylase
MRTNIHEARIPHGLPCDFCILAAPGRELESLLRLADEVKVAHSAGETIYQVRILPPDAGYRRGLTGMVIPTAVGRVEAALVASRVLHAFAPRLLFLIGIAGGFSVNGVGLGDLIVASRIVDYEEQRLGDDNQEFRLKMFHADEELLTASRKALDKDWFGKIPYPDDARPTAHIGSILSGDKVIASDRLAASLLMQDPSALGVEMEGGGAAAAASRARPPVRFLMIRGVVDLANDRKREDSQVWLDSTCEAVASLTLAILLQEQMETTLGCLGRAHFG